MIGVFGVTLTRRGRVVVGACLLGVVMAVAAGGRSLNAVVVPGLVALGAGYLQLSRIETPGVQRSGLTNGFVGETHEVRIEFHGDGPGVPVERAFLADVRDRLDDGLDGPDGTVRTAVGDESATYRVRYLDRGGRRFGPIGIEATDVFGLFARRMVIEEYDHVLAYPEVYPIPSWFRHGLYDDDALGTSRQREEFDRLREYARGDALRDVHWPATAKHDEIVVKEFAAETEQRRVSIAGETAERGTDAAADVLASAAASLALALLGDGIPVELSLPGGDVAVEPGPRGRRSVLDLAARTGPGSVPDAADADVRLVADVDDARFHTGGDRPIGFAELVAETGDSGTVGRDASGTAGPITAAIRNGSAGFPESTGRRAGRTDGGTGTRSTDGGGENQTDGTGENQTDGTGENQTDGTGKNRADTTEGVSDR